MVDCCLAAVEDFVQVVAVVDSVQVAVAAVVDCSPVEVDCCLAVEDFYQAVAVAA